MSKFLVSVLCAVLYGSLVVSFPVRDVSASSSPSVSGTSAETATATGNEPARPSPTVPLASDDPNYWLWNETTPIVPEPKRGTLGASILGPQNVPIDKQNPDILAPPTTDSGTV